MSPVSEPNPGKFRRKSYLCLQSGECKIHFFNATATKKAKQQRNNRRNVAEDKHEEGQEGVEGDKGTRGEELDTKARLAVSA